MEEKGEKRIYVRNPDVVLREDEPDGGLLFNPDTNQVRVLNPTGLFIWRACDGKKDLDGLIEALKEGFEGIPEADVLGQVKAFLHDMAGNGFIGTEKSLKK